MRKRIFCLAVFGLWSLVFGPRSHMSFAGVGVAGMNFLKTRAAARPLGMGNAFVAVADDISTLTWNVGGLANLSNQQFLFTHLSYLNNTACNNVGYAIAGKHGTLGIGFTMRSFIIDKIDVKYDEKGQISMKDMVFSFAYSRKFRNLFTYGCGVDLLNSVIGDYSVTTYGVNFGGLYFAPKGFVIGFAGQDIGPEYAYKTESFTGNKQPLPTTYIIGVTKKLEIPGGTVLATSEIVKDYTFRGNVGIEYELLGILALRGGYKIRYDSGGFTLGIGVNYKPTGLDRFQFDYAFTPMGGLGNSHCFSVITKF